MDGWQTLGAVLGGRGASRDDAFRDRMNQNLVLGARDHNLRQEVMKTEGLVGLGDALVQMGFDPGIAAGMAQLGRAGLNPGQYTTARGQLQTQGFREEARDAAVRRYGPDNPNAPLFGIASGPQQMATVQGDILLGDRFADGGGAQGPTEIGRARIGASNASAASSYATANNANVRSQIAAGQYDLSSRGLWNPDGSSGAPGGKPATYTAPGTASLGAVFAGDEGIDQTRFADFQQWRMANPQYRNGEEALAAYTAELGNGAGAGGRGVHIFDPRMPGSMSVRPPARADQSAVRSQPPVAGARQAPDGRWYVRRDGQTFLVEE